MTDDGDIDIDQIVQDLRERVAENGWTAVHVLGDAHSAGWTYSIGLDAYDDHPDLIIAAMEPRTAMRLLEDLARRVIRGERFAPGLRTDLLKAGYGLHFVAVPADIAPGLTGAGRAVREREITLLQVVWPNAQGQFPTTPDADPELTRLQTVFDPTWQALQ